MAKKMVVTIFLIGVIFLSGCASKPGDIVPAYVSPLLYEKYNCEQIAMEMDRVSRRLNEVLTNVKRKRNADSRNMAIGMVLFWPSLFFIKGDGPEAVEFARLQGEAEALEKVAIQKMCDQSMLPEMPVFEMDMVDAVFTNEDSDVFHRHDCLELDEDKKSLLEFKTAREALNSGGEPCNYCKPEKSKDRLKKGSN
tara:strand:- start:1455 stop:2039 length:585 start_codon:yes stop_codon:yes gene_type:complete